MNPIRDISITIMKAALVTIAVVVGFCVGSAFGLPVWLQAVFLIPAMLLFYRLSGGRPPSIWKILGFTGLLSIFVLLMSLGFKYVPDEYCSIYLILVMLLVPFPSIVNWFERRFFPDKNKSEQE